MATVAQEHVRKIALGKSEFRIVVATDRPSVGTFFTTLGGRNASGVSAITFDHDATALPRASRAVMEASVAVVDASIGPAEALDVCRELRAQRADLRIGILYCCTHAAKPESLRAFLAAGIGSFLDLQLSPEQMLAALRSVARGETVVRVQLNEESSAVLFNGRDKHERLSADDVALLQLVALGSTDHEIGDEMCLSHHTIKHRIERLRSRLHARNRIELAAIAGRCEGSHGWRGNGLA
jgi:DNA-binding NarL/FixJ family response regulator